MQQIRVARDPLFECENNRTRDWIGDTEAVAKVFELSRNESRVAIMCGRAFASPNTPPMPGGMSEPNRVAQRTRSAKKLPPGRVGN